jgi:hypothetical protein
MTSFTSLLEINFIRSTISGGDESIHCRDSMEKRQNPRQVLLPCLSGGLREREASPRLRNATHDH